MWPELHGRGLKICCIFFTALLHLHFHSTYTHTYVTWLSSIPCTVIGHYLKIKPTRTNVYICTCVHMFIIYYIITLLLYYMYMLLLTWQPRVCVVSGLYPWMGPCLSAANRIHLVNGQRNILDKRALCSVGQWRFDLVSVSHLGSRWLSVAPLSLSPSPSPIPSNSTMCLAWCM